MTKLISASRASLLSAAITSACCVPALILLAFSVGSATLGATLARYHWWFLGIGIILLGYSYYLFFREKRACSAGQCVRLRRGLTIVSLAVSTVVVLGFATSSLVPVISKKDVQVPSLRQPAPYAAVTFPVEGMTCFSCELHVEKVLGAHSGVREVKATAATSSVQVLYYSQKITPRQMIDLINSKTGYKAGNYLQHSRSAI